MAQPTLHNLLLSPWKYPKPRPNGQHWPVEEDEALAFLYFYSSFSALLIQDLMTAYFGIDYRSASNTNLAHARLYSAVKQHVGSRKQMEAVVKNHKAKFTPQNDDALDAILVEFWTEFEERVVDFWDGLGSTASLKYQERFEVHDDTEIEMEMINQKRVEAFEKDELYWGSDGSKIRLPQ